MNGLRHVGFSFCKSKQGPAGTVVVSIIAFHASIIAFHACLLPWIWQENNSRAHSLHLWIWIRCRSLEKYMNTSLWINFFSDIWLKSSSKILPYRFNLKLIFKGATPRKALTTPLQREVGPFQVLNYLYIAIKTYHSMNFFPMTEIYTSFWSAGYKVSYR